MCKYYSKLQINLVLKIINDGFPEGVDLFNLNVPSNYESEEVKITTLSHKMLDKKVIDNTDLDNAEIFNYPLDKNQESDDLIMITSAERWSAYIAHLSWEDSTALAGIFTLLPRI